MPETPLDLAFRQQEADPADPVRRLRFHERVLDAELLLLLEAPAAGDRLRPRVFELAEGRFVLAFDRDDRLAAVLDAPAPFAALAGRRLVAMLAGQGVGIGLNLGDAPSATLLPAEAVDWMAGMLSQDPGEAAERPRDFAAPAAPPELVAALGPKLAAMAEVIAEAFLVEAGYAGGDRRLLLVLTGVPEPAWPGVAAAVGEALRFSGLDDAALDVTFLGADRPERLAVERVALRFELPRPAAAAARPGPGTDPRRPPKLRVPRRR
jgi:SseB protein N-terminal domain